MPDKIKFYLDEMVPKAVADGLRARGIECVRTGDAENLSIADVDQLEFATRSGSVLFTRDSDFVELHSQGKEHCGIVYVPQQRRIGIGAMISSLCLVHDVLTPEEMRNHLEYL